MTYLTYITPCVGLLILIYTYYKFQWISKCNPGEKKMINIAKSISKGADAFLKSEYKSVGIFVIIVSIILFFVSIKSPDQHPFIVISFFIGSVFSALSGYIGMKVATKANVRTTQAARSSLVEAFSISFAGGSIMGMAVTGLALLGLGILFIIFYKYFLPSGLNNYNRHYLVLTLETITGFSLGAESVALFARVAGGIFTKAADVGADIVGKIESDIPEDDPRNPATIADNVGDNVGDVAGMGADLFGSYVATIIAAMFLGCEIDTLKLDNLGGLGPVILPMLIASVGTVISLFASFFIKITNESGNVQNALNIGNWIAIILTIVSSFFIIKWVFPKNFILRSHRYYSIGIFYSIIVGLGVGTLISLITEYFTSMGKAPVLTIVKQSSTGHGTNVIAGLSIGMLSTVLPMILFGVGIYLSFYFAGFYGVAIAASGMMATTAMQLSIDAFGPIADNAGGIAEMSELPDIVRERTDILDTVGNTTAATGKGFAIASAALTSLALFAAFMKNANINSIDIYKAEVLSGLFIGTMIPFFFSALTISAVGKAAMSMVNEVRRQFKEIKGILEGKSSPDYDRCIEISTNAAIKEMVLPAILALTPPIIIGFIFGPEVLGGFLAGLTVSGVIMAIFQSNAGGAWDNAKKSFEKGIEINGKMHYKGSDAHKSAVTGDTVGDPFKDTSGPSMNILIKLSTIVALIIAPHIARKSKIKEVGANNNTEVYHSDKR